MSDGANSVGGTQYANTYDANGNLAKAGENRHYEWNANDKLAVFKNQAGSSTPTVYTNYFYNAQGERVKKHTRKGNKVTVTVYMDGGLFETGYVKPTGTDIDNNRFYNTLHVLDGTSRIATMRVGNNADDSTPATKYNIEDHLGNSTVVLDTSGNLVNREEFYPFGETSFGGFAKKRYRYNGKEKDEESGLYEYGQRYYAAWLCRFISVDPAKEQRAWLTPYNYVQNNPINLTDPTGALDDGGGGGDPVKKGDSFVGDDGKTYTASVDEVEVTAVAPETLQSQAEKTYWGLRESQGGNPKMSEWDFSDSQESQLYHENGSLTGLGQLVNNIGIQQHYLETRTKDGAAGKFFESAFKEGGLNNFEIGELSQMRGEVVKSVKAQYLAGIFSEENSGVVLGLSLFSASAGLRETGKRTIQSIAPKAAEATEATTTALTRRANALSYHAEFERFALRGVTPKMAQKAIEKGAMYYDPKNKSINYILRNGFASGKDLLVGTNPLSGQITTVIRGKNLASKRMIPIQ